MFEQQGAGATALMLVVDGEGNLSAVGMLSTGRGSIQSHADDAFVIVFKACGHQAEVAHVIQNSKAVEIRVGEPLFMGHEAEVSGLGAEAAEMVEQFFPILGNDCANPYRTAVGEDGAG